MENATKVRLAVLTPHPIHYQAALWRRLSWAPDLEVQVFFCSGQGLDTADPALGYGRNVEWGLPLLQGYRSTFLRHYRVTSNYDSFWCRLNPGILPALARGRFDALFVHSYNNFTQLLAILAARRLGLKVLIRSEPTPLITVAPAWRRAKQILLPWLFRQVDACMAIGSLNRWYYQNYGVSEEKIYLMPYAVDNDYFLGQREIWESRRAQIKEELGLAADKVILNVGRFQARKRVMDLIRAYENLHLPGVALALVGLGEEFEACRRYVEERRLEGIHFLGFRNQVELPRLYAMADVFVLPSEAEPWGLVVNEAMCFGLPIIASDRVGSAYDLVQSGRNGFMYPCGDTAALTESLRETLAEGARHRLGQASLQTIRTWGLEENLTALRRALGLPVAGGSQGREPRP